jgi:hypothetical protein
VFYVIKRPILKPKRRIILNAANDCVIRTHQGKSIGVRERIRGR